MHDMFIRIYGVPLLRLLVVIIIFLMVPPLLLIPHENCQAEITHSPFSQHELLEMEMEMKMKMRVIGRMGSEPPSCTHKCGWCTPCDAVQAPAVTGDFGVQAAGYEPEDWKCKCGSSVYSP